MTDTVSKSVQFKLRLPSELKDRIEESAKRYNRSINAEILFALNHFYFPPTDEYGQYIQIDNFDYEFENSLSDSQRDKYFEALENSFKKIVQNYVVEMRKKSKEPENK